MKVSALIWFLVAQLVLGALLFQDALCGRKLLAPLDIAPALFTKYQYMDWGNSGVPRNHHIIDQLIYDLPLQATIYQTYRAGEIPWWDPYTFGGRPLLADAHISGTDPVRVLTYHLLPFELAYNWTRMLHFLLGGLGMFLLLTRFGIRTWLALLWTLTYQYAGCFTVFFGHPWVHASFVYYPFLWLVWDKMLLEEKWSWLGAATLLIAGIFYAGNLQSHAYLLIFAAAFVLGYGSSQRELFGKLLLMVASSSALGGLLAAPVLLNQVELFFLSSREIHSQFPALGLCSGVASVASIYPWILGTFRTLDLSKVFSNQSQLGFVLFIGSAAFVLALRGLACAPARASAMAPRRTALWLCGFYLLIISSPLVNLLYTRGAPLAVMGLVILAVFALETLLEKPARCFKLGWAVLGLAGILALSTNVFAFLIYPKLLPQVQVYVESHPSPSLDVAQALRRFQVQSLPGEISFRNPETILACLGLLGIGWLLLKPGWQKDQRLWTILLLLNLIPLLLYLHRYAPNQPLSQWELLKAGGPEHQRLAQLLGGTELRLDERAPGLHERALPGALAGLYRIRLVQGYAALRPPNLADLPEPARAQYRGQLADYFYQSPTRGMAVGELLTNATPGLARFQWTNPSKRRFTVRQSGLNSLSLSFQPGSDGTLLWTDTFYPGWKAQLDGKPIQVTHAPPCFAEIYIPPEAQVLTLKYQPAFLRTAKTLAVLGILILLTLMASSLLRPKRLFAPATTKSDFSAAH